MRIILVRHGETRENKQGIIQGHIQGTLSDLGKEQVNKLALRLKNENIDEIYSSDLIRALDTANAIAAFHTHAKIHITSLLRERSHGEFEGKINEEVPKEDFRKYFLTLENKPKGGESWIDVGKRAEDFIHQLLCKYNKKTIVIVSHGRMLIALLSVLTKTSPNDAGKFHKQDNTSVNIIEVFEDKSHKIHTINCTKHLN